ncbi:MAG: S-adenosylmethionine:tRNA ribosyltransferase-isomerase [Bacteroidales bacterium]|nr:S-adenosylmethionine:tRNA ribosyltransferase-isomerase [Candidatus Physcousia equi]
MNQRNETNPRDIRIEDYDYPLPDHRIARYPLQERDQSKLLISDSVEGIREDNFFHLPSYLPKSALMVFNNTRVIQARLHFRKTSAYSVQGALIEVFLLEPSSPSEYQENFAQRACCSWYCLVGNLKKWKEGVLTRELEIEGQQVLLRAARKGPVGTSQLVEFSWECCRPVAFSEVLDAVGELPIPPYLNRATEESDKTSYQTVYSKIEGSVAAPTAGLHFTDRVLAAIDAQGIEREEVTLHVGAGTFKPVKSEDIGGHEMHTEHIAVRRQTIERLLAHDGRAVAVGTTSVRTLESLYFMGVKASRLNPADERGDGEELHVDQWMPYDEAADLPDAVGALTSLLDYMKRNNLDVLHSSTQIIIAPSYAYRIVQCMVTNFHQPKSTLLLLVSALIGDRWHEVYDYALAHDFRFLSYGDSSLLFP